MARTGVTYTEVANAAVQLVGQNRVPTVEQVRLILGTGSSTTIANHLKQWKANQTLTQQISIKENLPPELISLMKGLWERVVNHSEEQMAKVESGYHESIAELQEAVEKYKKNNQRWQKLYDQWLIEKNQSNVEKTTLEQALEFAQKENASLHTKQDGLHQQAQDKQERIEELNRLNKQAQLNLEHYRESAREQRLIDQQQFEQYKQQLLSETKLLTEQLVVQRDKNVALAQQFQLLEQVSAALEKNHQETQSVLEITMAKLSSVEKEKNEHYHTSQNWQSQHTILEKNLKEKADVLLNLQVDVKLLEQQLIDAKQTVKDLQGINKTLNYESLHLSQEKSHLEGQLKQMQAMLVT